MVDKEKFKLQKNHHQKRKGTRNTEVGTTKYQKNPSKEEDPESKYYNLIYISQGIIMNLVQK